MGHSQNLSTNITSNVVHLEIFHYMEREYQAGGPMHIKPQNIRFLIN